jgi:trehalose 6-phosphate synthase/phosphatase
MHYRLLFVSNRLPATILQEDNNLKIQESVGGLASGLRAYIESVKGSSEIDYLWVGWPGATVDGRAREEVKFRLNKEFQAHPIFLSEKTMDKFYHGFCNRTIWPLFHYFPFLTVYDDDFWTHYKKVNEIFCEALLQIIKPEDLIWIHDYHLMLLPRLIRQKLPDARLAFFLHIPFPSFEVFRLLPSVWRREILDGLLGADLIGFHTYEYKQYFLRCVLRILGYEHNMGQIVDNSRILKVADFPMGINFQKFHMTAADPEVIKERDALRESARNCKIILSLDRLDYSKGIINRLKGYETFLEKNPSWHGKLVLVLAVTPSRIKVDHYQLMKRQIDELVGKINGKFGNMGWTPILYSYKFLPYNYLIALYSVSDIALITPLRDGMNLIAKEYIATKNDGKGVLILSEMAGAAKELNEAIIINPNNVEEIALALNQALEMPEDEQIRRNKIMQTRLQRYDVVEWVEDFIKNLLAIKDDQAKMDQKILNPLIKERFIHDFLNAQKRLLLLDYDGTLVPFTEYPEMATPPVNLLETLDHLSKNPRTELVLISGRERKNLQGWFDGLNINLVAEHGAWIRETKKSWKMLKQLKGEWKPIIRPLLERYANRLPGAFVEEKEFSLVLHYRKSDPEQAFLLIRELLDNLIHFTSKMEVQVLQGNKVVEVKSSGLDKGDAYLYWSSKNKFDFICAIGDDWTDEEMFKVMPDSAYSIRVGMIPSYAKFNLHNHTEVLKLLEALTE